MSKEGGEVDSMLRKRFQNALNQITWNTDERKSVAIAMAALSSDDDTAQPSPTNARDVDGLLQCLVETPAGERIRMKCGAADLRSVITDLLDASALSTPEPQLAQLIADRDELSATIEACHKMLDEVDSDYEEGTTTLTPLDTRLREFIWPTGRITDDMVNGDD